MDLASYKRVDALLTNFCLVLCVRTECNTNLRRRVHVRVEIGSKSLYTSPQVFRLLSGELLLKAHRYLIAANPSNEECFPVSVVLVKHRVELMASFKLRV